MGLLLGVATCQAPGTESSANNGQEKENVMYVYATNVGGANGQYVYVQPVIGGTVTSTGQQVFQA